MTDTLHEKLARVIYYAPTGFPDHNTVCCMDVARLIADEVIAALKLHIVIVGDFQTVIKGSYVTKWENDD